MTNLNNLTIAIPTFNRVEKAIEIIKVLAIQCNRRPIKLIVFDNDSDGGEKLMEYCDTEKVKYVKRKINIGPIGSMTRIFEEIDTRWLILLSDDDVPELNFVDGVLNEIREREDKTIAIKLKTSIDYNQRRLYIKDLDQFVTYNSDPIKFSSTLLLSSWIFDAEAVGKYMRFMYLYAGMQCGHLVGVMQCLRNMEGGVQYSEASYLKWNKPDIGEGWSAGLTYTLMLSTLPAANFLTKHQMKKLARGAVGSRTRTILGSLLRYKVHNQGMAFPQIARTVKSISMKHRFIVYIFNLIYPILFNSVKRKYFNADADKIGINRM